MYNYGHLKGTTGDIIYMRVSFVVVLHDQLYIYTEYTFAALDFRDFFGLASQK